MAKVGNENCMRKKKSQTKIYKNANANAHVQKKFRIVHITTHPIHS